MVGMNRILFLMNESGVWCMEKKKGICGHCLPPLKCLQHGYNSIIGHNKGDF